MKFSYSVFAAIALMGALAACKPAGPPPDIIKTQREDLQKARDVNAVQQKAVEEQQKQSEEATK